MSTTRPSPSDRPTRQAMVDVAVNLLWCVPGDVGGSEEYLVRQLLGLAVEPDGFRPTLYCLPAFVDAHPELAALYPVVAAPISGRAPPAPGARGEHLAGPALVVGRPRAPRRGHRPDRRPGADRADHPRPAVPDLSRVPDTGQASIPAHDDPALDPASDGDRDADGVRQVGRRRALRHRSVDDRGRAPRGRTASRPGCPERLRPAAQVRARVRAGDRVPGHHAPAQGPPVPARGDGPHMDRPGPPARPARRGGSGGGRGRSGDRGTRSRAARHPAGSRARLPIATA